MLTKMLTVGKKGTSGTLKLNFCFVVGWRHSEKRHIVKRKRIPEMTTRRTTLPGSRCPPKMRMKTSRVQRMTMIKVILKKRSLIRQTLNIVQLKTCLRSIPRS
jgi:hypothetical protein